MTHPVDTPRYRGELSQDAVQAEREKIADWLWWEIFAGNTTTITNHQAKIITDFIRDGAYQFEPTPREKLKGEKG